MVGTLCHTYGLAERCFADCRYGKWQRTSMTMRAKTRASHEAVAGCAVAVVCVGVVMSALWKATCRGMWTAGFCAVWTPVGHAV
jgi:hypothetical protein